MLFSNLRAGVCNLRYFGSKQSHVNTCCWRCLTIFTRPFYLLYCRFSVAPSLRRNDGLPPARFGFDEKSRCCISKYRCGFLCEIIVRSQVDDSFAYNLAFLSAQLFLLPGRIIYFWDAFDGREGAGGGRGRSNFWKCASKPHQNLWPRISYKMRTWHT